MKTTVLILITALTLFTSCSKDDEVLSNEEVLTEAEIPAEIKTYISTHFDGHSIIRAEKETDNQIINYEIYLSENFNLEFNSEYEITEIDGVTELPNSVIPQPILDYVTLNYPYHFISDWELEINHQQIELSNDLELDFDLDGNFLSIDND
ncbi:MAG TPA: PepSY-like domain-containing protein [Flavobacteriaceae bacterium]|nr:PepSY-like domain-containing protein [Flavobacteriaceae bacterium]